MRANFRKITEAMQEKILMIRARRFSILTAICVAVIFVGCGKKNTETEQVIVETTVETEEESSEEQTFFVHPREPEEDDTASTYSCDWEHGSCKYIGDKTVIVSIFLSDTVYSWNFEDENDIRCMQNEIDNLAVATEWIKEKTSEYGIASEFVYDWNENDDLKYSYSADTDICNSEDENIIWDIIDKEVNSAHLLEKYEAKNILYIIVQNVPKDWDLNALTWIYEEDPYPYEFCVMYPYRLGARVGAASYAHEILHAFGAHDLYLADEGETYVVTEEYVKHLKESGSRDIMYTVYDASKKQTGLSIPCEFTALDAYYVGIGDEPEEVAEYGLDKSEY